MSLHEMICNKIRPVYKCIDSLKQDRMNLVHPTINDGCILGDFHLMWIYPIEYVEQRVPTDLIDKHFELLT